MDVCVTAGNGPFDLGEFVRELEQSASGDRTLNHTNIATDTSTNVKPIAIALHIGRYSWFLEE
jgi:hypothetical protein